MNRALRNDPSDPNPEKDRQLAFDVRHGVARLFCGPPAINLFSAPAAIKLEHLTYLRLTLVSLLDISTVTSSIPKNVAAQLQHLDLKYMEDSSTRNSFPSGRRVDGTDEVDSDLERAHWDRNLMKLARETIQRCLNLRSLGIKGARHFDWSPLEWKSATNGLKNIYIDRGIISQRVLSDFLYPSHDLPDYPASSIETVYFSNVRLNDGTWANVFKTLLRFSSLRYIHLCDLTYSRKGSSWRHRRPQNRFIGNSSVLWSLNKQDMQELRELVKAVRGRGGCVSFYHQIWASSLEEVKEVLDDDEYEYESSS